MSSELLACVGKDYGPWITAGAILISAAVAIAVMAYNARIARRRATVDLLMHMRQSATYLDARKVVLPLQENKAQLAEFALLKHAATNENLCILEVLNANEFVAAGIFEGVFDESTLKRLRRSRLVRDWSTLETYVSEFRKSRDNQVLFVEFERLVRRWRK